MKISFWWKVDKADWEVPVTTNESYVPRGITELHMFISNIGLSAIPAMPGYITLWNNEAIIFLFLFYRIIIDHISK